MTDIKRAREIARFGPSGDRAAAQEVVDADSRRRDIRSNTRKRVELITVGLEHGDWRTLGYESPADWYAELTDMMLAPASIRRRLAEALHAEGYSLRRIATELDVSKTTVERDLDVSRDGTPGKVTGADRKSYPARNTTIRIEPEHDEAEPAPVTVMWQPHCPTCTCSPDIHR